jgi:CheY-like chemotaxis protein
VEDDVAQREAIIELIGNSDVQTTAVGSAAEALAELSRQSFDCMVADLRLPDATGLELIRRIKERPELKRLPVIVYTGKELDSGEAADLSQLAETIILKDVRSPERLLEETALFLHRVETTLPSSQREMLRQLAQRDPLLAGKRILIVDDDLRNVFAMTAVLEEHGTHVLYAENGEQALQRLHENPDIDLVLLDIMMPLMDGYEATRRIRQLERFARLPIIALTAKAMKEDRKKCIDAGASDYVTKPVQSEQLVSLMRVWLYR